MSWPPPDLPRQSESPVAADRPPSRSEGTKSGLRPLCAMMHVLYDGSLTELAWAIGLTPDPPKSPASRRLAELGFLASLLNRIPPQPGIGFALISRKRYDELRPAGATSSAALVGRYGSWNATCYAAYGLQADGRWLGPGRPWPSKRGRQGVKIYTREEVLEALRQCQRKLGRRPSQQVFERWSRERRRDAHKRGTSARIPGSSVVYRYYPSERGGWPRALRDAGI